MVKEAKVRWLLPPLVFTLIGVSAVGCYRPIYAPPADFKVNTKGHVFVNFRRKSALRDIPLLGSAYRLHARISGEGADPVFNRMRLDRDRYSMLPVSDRPFAISIRVEQSGINGRVEPSGGWPVLDGNLGPGEVLVVDVTLENESFPRMLGNASITTVALGTRERVLRGPPADSLLAAFRNTAIINVDDYLEYEAPTAAAGRGGDGEGTLESRLEEVKRLRDRGVITEEEYVRMRKKVLDSWK